MKTKAIYLLISSLAILLCFISCKKDEAVDMTDQELYNMAKATAGFTWYKNTDALLSTTIASGHTQPLLRTRYNTIAAATLDVDGKVMAGSVFPEGSLIVKELYDDANTLALYAIMFKKPGHKNVGAKDWVYSIVGVDGTVMEKASNKGVTCNACHSAEPDNIDNTVMNAFFP